MNFLDALRSGKPLRLAGTYFTGRHGTGTNYAPDNWYDPGYFLDTIALRVDDLLSEGWQVKEEPVPITAQLFWSTWASVRKDAGDGVNDYDITRLTLKKLGVK